MRNLIVKRRPMIQCSTCTKPVTCTALLIGKPRCIQCITSSVRAAQTNEAPYRSPEYQRFLRAMGQE